MWGDKILNRIVASMKYIWDNLLTVLLLRFLKKGKSMKSNLVLWWSISLHINPFVESKWNCTFSSVLCFKKCTVIWKMWCVCTWETRQHRWPCQSNCRMSTYEVPQFPSNCFHIQAARNRNISSTNCRGRLDQKWWLRHDTFRVSATSHF